MLLQLTINGVERQLDLEPATVTRLLSVFCLKPSDIVVEVNGSLHRQDFDEVVLYSGDVVEILHFMGGGS